VSRSVLATCCTNMIQHHEMSHLGKFS
jgi:hypothetical protein